MRDKAGGLVVWVRRGAFAIADQGLMSGSNFILTILLARWLVPEQYGAYALALSMFYFVSSGHQALMLEPMSVLGPSEYAGRQREYGGALLWFQAGFSLLLCIVFGAAGWITSRLGDRNLAAAMFGLAIGTPGILLFWLARISCYTRFTPATAASGACLYSVTLLGGAWALLRSGWLSAFTALALMGGAAVLVSLALIARAKPLVRCSRSLLRDVAVRHWSYGRWALGSSLVIWVPSNIFYSIIAAVLGIGRAGAFRAVMNLMFPVTHTCSALSLVFQPQLSRTAATAGPRATLRPVAHMATLYAAGALLWLTVVTFQTDRVWQLLYRGRFHEVSHLAVWLLAGVVFQVAAYAPAVGLRALQSPARVFAAYSIAAVVCVAGGVPATRVWGLSGAIGCYAVALVLAFMATVFLYRRGAAVAEEVSYAENPRPIAKRPQDSITPNMRLRILVSAYACEPGRGSEPGVGWNWAHNLAREHDVWVITRKNNRGVIEAALETDPQPNLRFVYADLPAWARFWKSWPLGNHPYYYLWQAAAYFRVRRLAREIRFDFVQHATYVKYWAPSFLALLGIPFLWGPVGGGESAPRPFRKAFGLRGKLYDLTRTAARAIAGADPFVRITAKRAQVGFGATADTAARLRALGCRQVQVFPAVALSDADLETLRMLPRHSNGPFRIASVGNLLHLKGFNLALEAFARFLAAGGAGEYWIIGEGPERGRLERLARRLNISGSVRFWGRLPRAEAIERLGECDVLAHPTLHDSGGWACLEAMAAFRPVVCLDLGGPGLVVTPESGIKIPAESPAQAIADLAVAFQKLAESPALRARLGEAGHARVWNEYRWEDKADRFLRLCGVDTRDEVLQ